MNLNDSFRWEKKCLQKTINQTTGGIDAYKKIINENNLHPRHLDPIDSSSCSLWKELCQGLLCQWEESARRKQGKKKHDITCTATDIHPTKHNEKHDGKQILVNDLPSRVIGISEWMLWSGNRGVTARISCCRCLYKISNYVTHVQTWRTERKLHKCWIQRSQLELSFIKL